MKTGDSHGLWLWRLLPSWVQFRVAWPISVDVSKEPTDQIISVSFTLNTDVARYSVTLTPDKVQRSTFRKRATVRWIQSLSSQTVSLWSVTGASSYLRVSLPRDLLLSSFATKILYAYLVSCYMPSRLTPLHFLFRGAAARIGPRPPHSRGFETTHNYTHTHGRTPLNQWSARRGVRHLHNAQQTTRDEHLHPQRESKPIFQQSSGRRPTP